MSGGGKSPIFTCHDAMGDEIVVSSSLISMVEGLCGSAFNCGSRYLQRIALKVNVLKSNISRLNISDTLIAEVSTQIRVLVLAVTLISGFMVFKVISHMNDLTKAKLTYYIDAVGSAVHASLLITYTMFVAYVIAQWIAESGCIYDGHINIGYLIHTSSGALYFMIGGLQFLAPLRRHYPILHRQLGYIFYALSAITTIGISWLAIKPHGGVSVQVATVLFLPLWVMCNGYSFRAIRYYRDVQLHKQLNMLGLATSTSIIFMRPITVILMLVDEYLDFPHGLGVAVWICFTTTIISTASYILIRDLIPSLESSQLQHDGSYKKSTTFNYATNAVGCLPIYDSVENRVIMKKPVTKVVSYCIIDSRTIMLRIAPTVTFNISKTREDHSNQSQQHYVPFLTDFPPGTYLPLLNTKFHSPVFRNVMIYYISSRRYFKLSHALMLHVILL